MRLNELKRALVFLTLLSVGGCYRGEHAMPLGSERHPPLPAGTVVSVLFNKPPEAGSHEFAIYQRSIGLGDTGGFNKYMGFVQKQALELGSSCISVIEENGLKRSVLTTHFLYRDATPASVMPSKVVMLRELMKLHNDGVFTDDEYAERKAQILALPQQ